MFCPTEGFLCWRIPRIFFGHIPTSAPQKESFFVLGLRKQMLPGEHKHLYNSMTPLPTLLLKQVRDKILRWHEAAQEPN